MRSKWRKTAFWGFIPGLALVATLGFGAFSYMSFFPGPLSEARTHDEPLEGYVSHAEFEMGCAHCHAPLHCVTDERCTECHKNVAEQRNQVSGLHGMLPGTDRCQLCHPEHLGREADITELAFKNVDHEKLSGFSLARHQIDYQDQPLSCESCHSQIIFVAETLDCVSCHSTEDHDGMAEHMELYGLDCLYCHDGVERTTDFNHDQVFVLEGGHDIETCEDCHAEQYFVLTPRTCLDCHEEPEVHADQFGFECARCHSTIAWTPAQLIQHTFILDHGEDGELPCETCHIEAYTGHTCEGCHDDPAEYTQTHLDEGVEDDQDCVSCHPTGVEGEGKLFMEGNGGQGVNKGGPDSQVSNGNPSGNGNNGGHGGK
jgi:hypothetical protein